MSTLGLDAPNADALSTEEMIEAPKGFWRRQFQKKATAAQKKFDWIFGVVLPVICFVFDPIVFKGSLLGNEGAWLGDFKFFAYVLSFVSVMAMSAWLIWGAKLKWLNGFLAGLFAVGGLISLGIGIVIFPISLLGLIVLIGVLGFTPLLTSIVFFRNARRAFHSAELFLEKSVLIRAFVLTGMFSAIVPWVLNVQIRKDLDEMSKGDAQVIRAKTRRLKYVAPLVNFDSLARQYATENNAINSERKAALAEAYQELTGKNLERQSQFLID
jgi:hypothetical protein